MNYINIDIDDLNEEKIIIPKKNYYCSNCNKRSHTFKTCTEPIISNGIIAIYIKNFNVELIELLEDYLIKNLKIFGNEYNKNNIQNNKYLNNHYLLNSDVRIKYNNINEDIQFLMVQRKNSLGYLEFIRGRYTIENISSITHLLEQMSPEEINDINNQDFDKL